MNHKSRCIEYRMRLTFHVCNQMDAVSHEFHVGDFLHRRELRVVENGVEWRELLLQEEIAVQIQRKAEGGQSTHLFAQIAERDEERIVRSDEVQGAI